MKEKQSMHHKKVSHHLAMMEKAHEKAEKHREAAKDHMAKMKVSVKVEKMPKMKSKK